MTQAININGYSINTFRRYGCLEWTVKVINKANNDEFIFLKDAFFTEKAAIDDAVSFLIEESLLSLTSINQIKQKVADLQSKHIGCLQERGYSVSATKENIESMDIETINYIQQTVTPTSTYSLYEIKSLLDNEKLTNNAIRQDIENLISTFPQDSGKPEQILL